MLRRIGLVAMMTLAACDVAGDATAVQAVGGPGDVLVTAPAVGQLAVTWSPDAAAWKYYVYQSTTGPSGTFSYVGSVLDPSHPTAPPAPTSWTATGVASGVQYCYAIQSQYGDGSTSDIGAAGCGTAAGSGASGSARLVSGLLARPMDDAIQTATIADGAWHFTGTGWMLYPLPVAAGETIAGFTWWASKSNPATDLHAELFAVDSTTGTLRTLGEDRFSASGDTGGIVLAASGLAIVASARTTYLLGVQEGFGTPNGTTTFDDAEATVTVGR